jgi:hypothetical protein
MRRFKTSTKRTFPKLGDRHTFVQERTEFGADQIERKFGNFVEMWIQHGRDERRRRNLDHFVHVQVQYALLVPKNRLFVTCSR